MTHDEFPEMQLGCSNFRCTGGKIHVAAQRADNQDIPGAPMSCCIPEAVVFGPAKNTGNVVDLSRPNQSLGLHEVLGVTFVSMH